MKSRTEYLLVTNKVTLLRRRGAYFVTKIQIRDFSNGERTLREFFESCLKKKSFEGSYN